MCVFMYLRMIGQIVFNCDYRIFSQPKGQIPDYGAPVVLHDQTPSVEDLCNKLHKQVAITQYMLRYACMNACMYAP